MRRWTKKGRRRQADFKKAACYPSAVVQGAARRKNSLFEESARGNCRVANFVFNHSGTP